MQGNDKIIEVLNQLLAEELTAINQYVVHSEMCSNWGYERLHDVIEKTAIDEMKHAEKIIARILFLEGRPRVRQTQFNSHWVRCEWHHRERPKRRTGCDSRLQ